jgi:hypothetical protein
VAGARWLEAESGCHARWAATRAAAQVAPVGNPPLVVAKARLLCTVHTLLPVLCG